MGNVYPYATEPTHLQGSVAITGSNSYRTSSTANTEGRLIIEMGDSIQMLEPTMTPLSTLFTNVGKSYQGGVWKGSSIAKQAVDNPEFKCMEDQYGGRYCKVSTAYAASAGTIYVTGAGSSSAYIFTVGDLFKNLRTGEIGVVLTVASTTSITCTHAFGTTAAAAGAAGDELIIVGNVNEESSGARNANTTYVETASNYTAIAKMTVAVAGTNKEINMYGGNDLKFQRTKKGIEHARDIERAFWFSEKKSSTGSTQSHPMRATGGIHEFINAGDSYVQYQGGPLTAPDCNLWVREAFTYSSDGATSKTVFAGNIFLSAINEIARGQIQTRPMDTSYGMNISEWVTPFGRIKVVSNPIFVGELSGYAYCLDMGTFGYRYIRNRDTKLLTNVQANDTDGEVDQWLSTYGLYRTQAPCSSLIKGITG